MSLDCDVLRNAEPSVTQERGGAVPSKGIANLGNTCFFNSVLQNLVRTEPLRSCVQHGVDAAAGAAAAAASGSDAEAGTAGGGPLTDELAAFFKTMCATARDGKKKAAQPVRPKDLFEELIRQSPRYKGYQQHDAHELLVTLLDLLRMEERKRLKARAESTAASSTASEDTDAVTETPCARNKPPTTYVEHLFGGQWRSGITCKRCGQESVILEPFLDLCLPILVPAPPAVPKSASQPMEEVSKREKKKQLLALSAEKQRLKKEAKKERGKISGSADAAANEDASGDGAGGGKGSKGRKKFMSNHEKKLEMARIRAEKIAAARIKRRRNASSDSSSVSSDEDAAHRDTADTQDRAGSRDQEAASQAAQDSAQDDEDACGKVTTSEASLSKQEKAAAKAALKAAKRHHRDLLKQPRTGSSGNTGASTSVSSSCAEEEQEEEQEEEEANEVPVTRADQGIRGRVEDNEGEGGVGEDDLDAFLGDDQHQVPYDEDTADDFLAQQDAIAMKKRWQASADMEAVTADMEAVTTREDVDMPAGQQDEARLAEAAVRPPPHAHNAKDGTGRADFDAEAAGLVRGGDSGVDGVVQELVYLHIAGLEEIGAGGGKDCGVGAGGGDNVGKGGHQDAQSAGDEKIKVGSLNIKDIKVVSPRLSGAPLGLAVEDDACQSRGVAAAVRQGLVEASSVLEGLRQYVKVELLDGDNLYCCQECSRKFREQGRERMAEARQRLSCRQSHGSASDDELDNVHGAFDEESVRAEVKSPALKQSLLWTLPPFLILNLKRFIQTAKGRTRKVDDFITFPLSLDVGPFCHRDSPETCTCYALYGCVEHHGNLSSGHYVAYSSDWSPMQKGEGDSGDGRGEEDTEDIAEGEGDTVKDGERQGGAGGGQQWHYFSDTTVKPVPVEKVLKSQAYILFYRRQ